MENRKIGVRELPEGGLGAPYIGCTGRFLGGGEARMDGFTAEFRGFRSGRGCGAAIQHTADAAGLVE